MSESLGAAVEVRADRHLTAVPSRWCNEQVDRLDRVATDHDAMQHRRSAPAPSHATSPAQTRVVESSASGATAARGDRAASCQLLRGHASHQRPVEVALHERGIRSAQGSEGTGNALGHFAVTDTEPEAKPLEW